MGNLICVYYGFTLVIYQISKEFWSLLQIPKIILVHNHPSGNAMPSNEDIQATQRIRQCCEMMGIQLLDHIVIGDGEYNSAM